VKPIHPNYPASGEVDGWCETLVTRALNLSCRARRLPDTINENPMSRHVAGNMYVRFELEGHPPYYGYWQPVPGGGPAPLLLHVPGYGAEMSRFPEAVVAGFNVLHISPLGYCTPEGFNLKLKRDDRWPVLPDTIITYGEHGYVDWLTQVVAAARWARRRPSVQADRVGAFGTSQGGGGALLLGSLLRGHGVKAVAADLPFLTNLPLVINRETSAAYAIGRAGGAGEVLDDPKRSPGAWRALGFVDTLSHAHRLTMPVMLTGGTLDPSTPTDSIRSLFEALPGTRSYTELAGQQHGYTVPFLRLALAWFGLYL
jgi:cephalosporin-C deacetylase-like acetyl esterase